jgi:hypothetical protein
MTVARFLILLFLCSTFEFGFAQANDGKGTKSAKRLTKGKVKQVLKGSPAAIRKENQMIAKEKLGRVKNDAQRDKLRKEKKIVQIPRNSGIKPTTPKKGRYVRPETAKFVGDLGILHKRQFPKRPPLRVTSALRTIDEQNRLRKHNGNAIPPTGPMGSSHPAAATIDIGRGGLSSEEDSWLGYYLAVLEISGKIQATKETSKLHKCYHVMVFRTYLSTPKVLKEKPKTVNQKGASRKHHAARLSLFLKSVILYLWTI